MVSECLDVQLWVAASQSVTFIVPKTKNQSCLHSCTLWLAQTVWNNSTWAFSHFNRTPKLWPFSVYEGICLSSFTGCKHRLHSPINDHYQPNDSSGWPGKIKMGITSRQIRYFYLCTETYTFMECCFWIVQWMDCSWNSASRGFNNSTAVFGASFTGLKPVSLFFEYFDETQTVCGGRLLVCWNLKQQYQHRHLLRCEVLMWGHSSVK